MTRSEPYKKNDNMCIEERNGSISRKHLGYTRMDHNSLVETTCEIIRIACLLHNHFRPVRRMTSKTRIDAKWKRTFENIAKTPYERVREHKDVMQKDKENLKNEHEKLNPMELKRKLDILKAKLGRELKVLKNRATG
jgi:hypothetical protein